MVSKMIFLESDFFWTSGTWSLACKNHFVFRWPLMKMHNKKLQGGGWFFSVCRTVSQGSTSFSFLMPPLSCLGYQHRPIARKSFPRALPQLIVNLPNPTIIMHFMSSLCLDAYIGIYCILLANYWWFQIQIDAKCMKLIPAPLGVWEIRYPPRPLQQKKELL